MFEGCCPATAGGFGGREPDVRAHFDFPPDYWKHLCASNMRESLGASEEVKAQDARVLEPGIAETADGRRHARPGRELVWPRYFSERAMPELYEGSEAAKAIPS